MLLRDYLADRGIKPAQFARDLSVSKSYIHGVLTGDRRASLSLALQIETHTGGEVPPADLDAPWRERNPAPPQSVAASIGAEA